MKYLLIIKTVEIINKTMDTSFLPSALCMEWKKKKKNRNATQEMVPLKFTANVLQL